MKKKILFIGLLLMVFFGGAAAATSINGEWNGLPIVKLMNKGLALESSDSPAVILNNHVYVPLKALSPLGVQLTWDADQYSVDIKMPQPTPIVKIVHPALTQEKLDELAKSVYEIISPTDDPKMGNQGTGFIIDGVMFTNQHVLGNAVYTNVLIDGQWQKVTSYIFSDKQKDLAGFKITGGTSLPYSTVLPEKDDIVYAIGFPAGKLTITEGIVRFIDKDSTNLIVNSAKVEGGNSGGILLNSKGEIIGINRSGGMVGEEYYDFAIPISYALQELK